MHALHTLRHRVLALFRRRRLEQDLDDELAFHFAMSEADRVRAGDAPLEARASTRRQFGRVASVKEHMRDAWMFGPAERRVQDLRFAVRMLRRTPVLTVVAITTLALGMGATTAVFSLFQQTLLRPLPVPEPDRLVNLSAPGPKDGESQSTESGGTDDLFSYPMFRDLEREQTVFTAVAAHELFDANLAHGGQTLHGKGFLVSGGYFPALALTPAIGRLLGPDDDRVAGDGHAVVLAYAYWQARFHADPSVLNQSMIVNGQVMTIVGVAPEGFSGTTLGRTPLVFAPITMRRLMVPEPGRPFADRRNYWVYLFARLRPGVTTEQARALLNVSYHDIINDVEAPLNKNMYPEALARFKAKTVVVTAGRRGQSETPGQMKPALTLLFGVTLCVLLIACANIANLLLARAAAREGEMVVRLSIGASRSRLVAQLLTESSVLAVCGGLAGLVVARWTMAALTPLLPPADALSFDVDRTMLLFTAGMVLATGSLFGLVPALHGTRATLSSLLKNHGQPISARRASQFRASLATAQIALSLTLLVAAGLFVKSLVNVSRIDLGFNADRIVTFGISPGLNAYSSERAQQLVARLEDAIGALPGVAGVTDAQVRLLASNNTGNTLSVEGFATTGSNIDANALMNEVGPSYFRALGIPMLAGREFTAADIAGSPKVAVVNEAFARKFNLGSNPVGKRMGDPDGPLVVEIVGLARNAKYSEVKDDVPALYFRPTRQSGHLSATNMYVRTERDPDAAMALIPKAVAALDPDLPVEDLRTLPQQVRENVAIDRLISVLSAAFAILAMLLAAVGLYGVLAYTVSQRTRELGLRMALGAAPAQVRAMILRQVGRLTLTGSVLGLVAAFWLGHAAQALLYGLQGSDPAVFIESFVVLAAVGLLAGWLPAWRASRIDPADVLRQG